MWSYRSGGCGQHCSRRRCRIGLIEPNSAVGRAHADHLRLSWPAAYGPAVPALVDIRACPLRADTSPAGWRAHPEQPPRRGIRRQRAVQPRPYRWRLHRHTAPAGAHAWRPIVCGARPRRTGGQNHGSLPRLPDDGLRLSREERRRIRLARWPGWASWWESTHPATPNERGRDLPSADSTHVRGGRSRSGRRDGTADPRARCGGSGTYVDRVLSGIPRKTLGHLLTTAKTEEFLLPVVLTVVFIPFLVVLRYLVVWQTMLHMIRAGVHGDDALYRLARRSIVRACGTSL
jgi:hypothetical protein